MSLDPSKDPPVLPRTQRRSRVVWVALTGLILVAVLIALVLLARGLAR